MGRLKQNIKISDNVRKALQNYANINADIEKMYEMTDYPELAELLESQNCDANTICQFLCKELNIIGHIDKQFLQSEEEYYESNGMLKQNYVKRYSK